LNGIGKALPKRRNYVISSKKIDVPNIDTFSSLEEAISTSAILSYSPDVWLIGGASIYAEGMSYADKILLTITPDIITRRCRKISMDSSIEIYSNKYKISFGQITSINLYKSLKS
jgi:dihydrofolate reductase